MNTDLNAIAAAARSVAGVSSAVVDPDEDGGVGALRLDLVPGTDGLSVAGAISRLLLERFGTVVDPDHVHIHDAADPPTQRPVPSAVVPVQGGTRPTIVRSDVAVTGFEVSATVVLCFDQRAATGAARGAATTTGMRRQVAQATLRAVERLVGDAVRFELEHLELADTGGERTVLVGLTMVSARGAERLTGTALVRDDEGRSVIRATLDALNRRLEALLA